MMKRWSRILLTVLVLGALILPTGVVRAAAASKDVTSGLATDKALIKVVDRVSTYTTALELGGKKSDQEISVRLDDKTKLSIAGFVRYQFKYQYRFTANELKKDTKDLFGKAANVKNTSLKGAWICKGDRKVFDPYMYCGGDFGDVIPKNKILAVEEVKDQVYLVTVANEYGIYGEKGTESLGQTKIRVRKTAKGYVVKGISYIAY